MYCSAVQQRRSPSPLSNNDRHAIGRSGNLGAEKIVTNLYARSVFFVADADRSLRYYTEQLGFSLDWDSNDGVFQVSLFGFELILNQVEDRTRTRAGHGRVFIGLEDDQDERSEEHTSELQSHLNLVCRLLL